MADLRQALANSKADKPYLRAVPVRQPWFRFRSPAYYLALAGVQKLVAC